MSYRYFEDFRVGETIELGSRSVSEAEIVDFATQFDPQFFHMDRDAARDSIFGGLIASGWHSCGVLMRLMVDAVLRESSSLGSPGVDEIRWVLPLRPGDTVSARYEVLDTRASVSKPDRGVVSCRCTLTNQNGEITLTMHSKGLFRCRPA